MYKVGLSSSGFALSEENFKKLERSGVSAVEVSMPSELYGSINYHELAELSARYSVELWSYHLPFWPFTQFDLSSTNGELRKSTVEYYTQLIEKAADMGIDKFIVHPSGEPIGDDMREERIKCSMQSLNALAEIAHQHGAVIAVEDLPRTCLGNTADEIRRLISANDKLRVCFDTNHLLCDTNMNFMEKLGNKIITIHVSDYDLIDEKHWLPGEGLVNWSDILTMLQKINYNGVWMYEIGLSNPKMLTRSRDLTFEDFVENANALFAGKQPKRI
ncbi:MAG: sugar phosphate isomerase/epimerase [Ruminococcaceae bacterium]|nr:sugar phosphate isomerase/epimerase [Oscillospiraceae bacterium]